MLDLFSRGPYNVEDVERHDNANEQPKEDECISETAHKSRTHPLHFPRDDRPANLPRSKGPAPICRIQDESDGKVPPVDSEVRLHTIKNADSCSDNDGETNQCKRCVQHLRGGINHHPSKHDWLTGRCSSYCGDALEQMQHTDGLHTNEQGQATTADMSGTELHGCLQYLC